MANWRVIMEFRGNRDNQALDVPPHSRCVG